MKQRDSNIELMRLMMMMMILIHHMICHGIFGADFILCNVGGVNSTSVLAVIINSFCYIGVNGFILISGYYGIKFKIRSLLNLYLICAFYSLIMHLIEIYALGTKEFSLGTIKDIVFVFSQQDYWWFMNCYIILYLMSPMLNKALNIFDKHEYKKTLVLLTIANLYFGYWWRRYASDGYSVAQFVYLYVIGRYIGRFIELKRGDSRYQALLIYIFVILAYSILSICSHYFEIPHWYSFPYNNPLLIIGSIAFFLFMIQFHFQSHIINRVAVSSLSIYLLQNMKLMKVLTYHVSKLLEIDFTTDDGLWVVFMLIIYLGVFSITFMIVSVLIDQLRIFLVTPVIFAYDKMSNYYSRKYA